MVTLTLTDMEQTLLKDILKRKYVTLVQSYPLLDSEYNRENNSTGLEKLQDDIILLKGMLHNLGVTNKELTDV